MEKKIFENSKILVLLATLCALGCSFAYPLIKWE